MENYIDSLDSVVDLANILLVGNSDSGHIPLEPASNSFVPYGNTDDTLKYTHDWTTSYTSNKEIEVPVGLISIRSQEELNNAMHKILAYTSKKYLKNEMSVIGLNPADIYFFVDAQSFRDKANSLGINVDYLYPMSNDDIDSYWHTLYNLINNESIDFLLYDSHGIHNGWGSTTIDYLVTDSTMKENLSNSQNFPIIFSAACFTGQLRQGSPCFAENMLSMESGASTVIANSNMVILTENSREVNKLTDVLGDKSISTVGEMVEACRLTVSDKGNYYLLGVYGDPALKFQNFDNNSDETSVLSNNSISSKSIEYIKNGIKFNSASKKQIRLYSLSGRELINREITGEKFFLPSSLSKGLFVMNVIENGKLIFNGVINKQ
jgi:hypothetical protein